MNEYYVKLELEAPQHGRTQAYSGEDQVINGATKEVGFGVYRRGLKTNKTEKEDDVLIAYVPQQQIV